MRSISLIIVVICLSIVTGCESENYKSLGGKKLYLLSQGNKGGIGELELDFENDAQVKLKLTCMYYSDEVKLPNDNDLLYLKRVLSGINGTYPFTYKDEILTIPNTSFINLKLTYSNRFYTDSHGQLYNDKSILDLSSDKKIERLKQVNFSIVSNGQVPHEIVLNTLK